MKEIVNKFNPKIRIILPEENLVLNDEHTIGIGFKTHDLVQTHWFLKGIWELKEENYGGYATEPKPDFSDLDDEQQGLADILGYYGMPVEHIRKAIVQIAQGYGACRYLDGVANGADAVNNLEKDGNNADTNN